MKGTTRIRILVVCAIILPGLFTACNKKNDGSEPENEPRTLKIWHYESQNGAMGTAWAAAMKKFEETHPGVEIEFENKGFEQIRQTAQMILNSDQAPDVMEYNKGNATAGMLVRQGLLTDLTGIVEQKGWDKLLSSSLQTTCRYDSEGIMGSGKWYGVTNYGEYVMVYYNKDMFAKEEIPIPHTLKEFEAAMEKFKKREIVPIALGAAEYPAQQVFYELVLQKAGRAFVDDFQLYANDVDFQCPEMMYGAKKMREWVNKGYISQNAVSLKAEDMGLLFENGKSPIMISGSWWYGRLKKEIKNFRWGVFLFPGNKLHPGSGGNIWVVPSSSKNKQLAYDFIDITMQTDIQSILGNEGGIPVNADIAKISDPQIKDLISNFDQIIKTDGLAFYPDWPASGFYDTLVAGVQELMHDTKTPDQFLVSIGKAYFDNKMQ